VINEVERYANYASFPNINLCGIQEKAELLWNLHCQILFTQIRGDELEKHVTPVIKIVSCESF
jgi:hypothetical protein